VRRTWRVVKIVGLTAGALWFGIPSAVAGGGGAHCEDPLAEGAGTRVEMFEACFTPAVLHVEVGEDVTFENLDPVAHNIAPAGWGWGHIDALHQGDTYVARFDEEGVYPFACSLHPGMTGAIIAGSGGGSDAAVPVSTTTTSRRDGPSPWWIAVAGAAGLGAGFALSRVRVRVREEAARPYQPVPGE
jgi:plastocyanin